MKLSITLRNNKNKMCFNSWTRIKKFKQKTLILKTL